MKVIDVDPDVKGRVRCKCCDTVMPLADVLLSGDSLVCPICGGYERFIDEDESCASLIDEDESCD